MLGFVENQGRGWGSELGPGCPPLEENELECLRLTISAPEGHKAGDKLAVMVWVHGYPSHSLPFTPSCSHSLPFSFTFLTISGAMTAGAGASLPRESNPSSTAIPPSLHHQRTNFRL